jgi:hypothetical protein
MKTKKVRVSRASAAFSTAIATSVSVTIPRPPWDTEPDYQEPERVTEETKRREPRHLGPYTRRGDP